MINTQAALGSAQQTYKQVLDDQIKFFSQTQLLSQPHASYKAKSCFRLRGYRIVSYHIDVILLGGRAIESSEHEALRNNRELREGLELTVGSSISGAFAVASVAGGYRPDE